MPDVREKQKMGIWKSIVDMTDVKDSILNAFKTPEMLSMLNEYRKMWKQYHTRSLNTLKYTSDPVNQILTEPFFKLIDEEHPMIYESHVLKAVSDGFPFLLRLTSEDTASRPIRNWLIDYLVNDPVRLEKLRQALKQERDVEDYTNPDNWYDNMKVNAKKITKDKQLKGLIPSDGKSIEETMFIDKLHYEHDLPEYIKKTENKKIIK